MTTPTNKASTSTIPKLPLKRLTPSELQSRREKSLCYNYDEKFVPGHKCKALPQLLFLEDSPSIVEMPDTFTLDDFLAEEL